MTNLRSSSVQLLDLPSELLFKIFSDVLTRLDIQAEPGSSPPERTQPYKAVDSQELNEHRGNIWHSSSPPIPPIYQITSIPPLLLVSKYTCELLSKLVWESHVRFVFPSTVALMDVLLAPSQQHRVQRLRRISFRSSPLPVSRGTPDSEFTTFGADTAMQLVEGLQLDLLEVNDVYLTNNDSWGRREVLLEMNAWIRTPGWHELHFLVEEPYFQEHEVMMLAKTAMDLRTARKESDFTLELPTTPVLRSEKTGHVVGIKVDEDYELRNKNYHARNWGRFRNPANGIDAQSIARMVCKRGFRAEYVQLEEGQDTAAYLKELLTRMSWIELRECGCYLLDEGLDNPLAYL